MARTMRPRLLFSFFSFFLSLFFSFHFTVLDRVHPNSSPPLPLPPSPCACPLQSSVYIHSVHTSNPRNTRRWTSHLLPLELQNRRVPRNAAVRRPAVRARPARGQAEARPDLLTRLADQRPAGIRALAHPPPSSVHPPIAGALCSRWPQSTYTLRAAPPTARSPPQLTRPPTAHPVHPPHYHRNCPSSQPQPQPQPTTTTNNHNHNPTTAHHSLARRSNGRRHLLAPSVPVGLRALSPQEPGHDANVRQRRVRQAVSGRRVRQTRR